MVKNLQSGSGWRLGCDRAASEFQGLVGGDDWAIELTAAEFADFCRLATQLAATMAAMSAALSDQERLTCEQETSRIWLEAEGYADRYSLRFILLTGRRGEGGWAVAATKQLLQALANSNFFEAE
ncbi:DUF1818 family protein [Romeria aff. gracilis LEGE 07310]|uniref:DUF1818 family protein n=1 Tax=Vasconcelosia minhoensis LEGE 07310 TaxID=915328 RepID=A0A8J7AGG8_9CYAN|nr:DUF1818 family protein [Romeria gracilis]MBE9078434.1 DUF1818 family protein [Romeria aff. gracilis LEGE 07310]